MTSPAEQPLRLAFLTPLYVPDVGGAEILLDRLLRSLQARGHQVVLVAPRRRGTRSRLPYPVVRTYRPFSKRFGLHHCLPNLFWARWRHPFDLVHCHSEYRAACVARTFRRLTGVPYVVRAVGGDFQTVAGRPALRARVERAVADASGFIAQGAFLRSRLLEAGAPPEKVVTIHNGADPEEIRVDGPAPRPGPYIFFAGGLRPEKGFDLLLRAFAQIAPEVAPVQLVMAGTDHRRADFDRLCGELRLGPPRVEYLGFLDRRQMALHLRHALFYACPFRVSPFSNANLEALTAGQPIVATDVDGNAEQIRHEREGLIVPPEDVAALAAAMRRLCLDRALRDRLAAGAVGRAQDFTWDAMVERYVAFYRRVLAGLPPAG